MDIAIGGGAFGTSGEVRIVTGPIAGTMGWAEADLRITTDGDFEGVGSVAANPGDLDGDSVQDLLVGANLLDKVGLFLGGGL